MSSGPLTGHRRTKPFHINYLPAASNNADDKVNEGVAPSTHLGRWRSGKVDTPKDVDFFCSIAYIVLAYLSNIAWNLRDGAKTRRSAFIFRSGYPGAAWHFVTGKQYHSYLNHVAKSDIDTFFRERSLVSF